MSSRAIIFIPSCMKDGATSDEPSEGDAASSTESLAETSEESDSEKSDAKV